MYFLNFLHNGIYLIYNSKCVSCFSCGPFLERQSTNIPKQLFKAWKQKAQFDTQFLTYLIQSWVPDPYWA